jgi:hypothetical protein
MRKITKRTLAISTAAAIAIGGGAAAWAWSLGGAGDTTAHAESAQDLTITGVSVSGLAPGLSVPVNFTAGNKNKYKVRISGATFSNLTVDSAHSGCAPDTDVVLNTADMANATGTIIGAGDGTNTYDQNVSIPHAISMSQNASDACKDATFTVHVVVNATTSA